MIAAPIVLIRLGLALAFGAAIGVEREWRHKHAGLKTMVLVAMGAATFAMMSNTFGPANHNPAQLAAAVVGGIGFIGAGVIMHRGTTVEGVTTAATLWVTSSVGVAVGLGQYALGGVLAGAIVIVQIGMRSFEDAILRARRHALPALIDIRIDCEEAALPAINAALAAQPALHTLRRAVDRTSEHLTLRVTARVPGATELTALEATLLAIPAVHGVDLRHLGLEEE